jgi:hypothetical protein
MSANLKSNGLKGIPMNAASGRLLGADVPEVTSAALVPPARSRRKLKPNLDDT